MSIRESRQRVGTSVRLGAARRWLGRALGSDRARIGAVAFGSVVVAYLVILAPMLRDFSTYGFHDWDAHAAYRYITTLSLGRYGEGPWWHPYLCGGVPAWGYVEGAPNLVSPYLPFYLLADIRTAIRVEVLGNGLLGIAGAFVLARRFSSSGVLAAFFAALYVLNGRFALQAAVGHTWHLQYAILPWLLWCFERAREPAEAWKPGFRPSRFVVLAGFLFAYLCYAGAIYPLPHAVLFVGLYVAAQALWLRSFAPLRDFALAGCLAFGLAAPKLLAISDYMRKAPRLIASPEQIGLSELLVMLTDPSQRFNSFPVRVPAYNWHEWGIYVGVGGLLALALGLVFASGPRGQTVKLCGLICLLLGFGSFHEFAPWTLLHVLPPFSSQHVPSRFHYVMLLFLGLAFVEVANRWLMPRLAKRPLLEAALLVPLLLFLIDLVRVNQVPFEQAFWMRAPAELVRREKFEHFTNARVAYVQPDWAAPMLLSMFVNRGVIRCYGADPSLEIGAIAADTRGYPGQAYVVDGPGRAEVVEWTPNRAVVRVQGAEPGALIAYNMNYDPSWSAEGRPAEEYRGVVAARLPPGATSLGFSYFPRTFAYSLPILGLTLALLALGSERVRSAISRARAARRA